MGRNVVILLPEGWRLEECCVKPGETWAPGGALVLAAYLRKMGHRPIVKLYRDPRKVDLPFEPDAAVIYAPWMAFSYASVPAFHAMKRAYPGCTTILLMYESLSEFEKDAMMECREIDYAVIPHEKEISVARILESDGPSCPGGFGPKAGVLYRDENGIPKDDGRRPFAGDLSHLPYAGDELLRFLEQNPTEQLKNAFIILSRGCPGTCVFCPLRATRERHRALDDVLKECRVATERLGPGSTTTLTLEAFRDPAWAGGFADLILRDNDRFSWQLGARCEFLAREPALLRQLKAAGLAEVYLGIECGTEEMRARVQKPMSDRDVGDAIDVLEKAGIAYEASFITGFPWEDETYMQRMADCLRRVSGSPLCLDLQLSRLIPYPGLPVEKILVEEGIMERGVTFTEVNHNLAETGRRHRKTKFLDTATLEALHNNLANEIQAFRERKASSGIPAVKTTGNERYGAVSKSDAPIVRTGPKVSLLMGTYNRPDYLREAIQSVIAQTMPDWELILMNDGGVDVSDVVDAFHDDRIVYVNDTVNRGLAVRLNLGLRRARGKYIAYLGDDDLYYPNHFEVLSRGLDENPDVGAVYSDLYAVQFIKDESNGRRYPVHKFIQVSRDYNRDFMFYFNHTLHVSLMHRKDVALRAGGYDESVKVLIDWDITRKLSFYTDFKYIPVITGEYYMPLHKSDRISFLERQDKKRYEHNLRKIRADFPPEPWPKVDRIGAILIVKEWDEQAVEKIRHLIDQTLYPATFILINNDMTKESSGCKEILGEIGELRNLIIHTPPQVLTRVEAYRWGAERFDGKYIYLPCDKVNEYGLMAARHFLNENASEGVRWTVGKNEENAYEILMRRDAFLRRTHPLSGTNEMDMERLPYQIPESLWCDLYSFEAAKHHRQGNYQSALQLLQMAEKTRKGGIGNQYLIDLYSKICFDLKQYDQAEERCRTLIARGYGADNWVRLGKILQERRQWHEAIDAYRSGLDQIGLTEEDLESPAFPIFAPYDFGSFTALIGLGECLFETEDFSESARMFRRAAKLRANSPRPFLGFGRLFFKNDEIEKAEMALREAFKRNGKDPEVHRLLGRIYEKRELPENAYSFYLNASRLDPGNAETAERIYAVGAALGKWEELKTVLEEFLRHRPGHVQTLNDLASLYYRLGDYERTGALVEQGLLLDGNHSGLKALHSRIERTHV